MKSGIYEIVSPSGGRYIGSASDIPRRWRQHRHTLRNNHKVHPPLRNAWNKYGESAMRFSILLLCSIADLTFFEERAIAAFRPEYNSLPGAVRRPGHKLSPETIQKLRARRASPETRARLSAAGKLRRHSEATRAKMSATRKGMKPRPLGRKHSLETRLKMSLSHIGIHRSPKWRANISASKMGHVVSEETRQKISLSVRKFLEQRQGGEIK